MTILYSNGCSFTANFNLKDTERYPFLIAQKLNWDVIQCGEPGSCNNRIIRTTIADCIKLLNDYKDIIALVQLTFLHRTEFPITEKEQGKVRTLDPFISVKPEDKSLSTDMSNALKIHTVRYNQHAYFIDLMSKIIGLTSFFKCNNIDYRIFFGPKELKIDPTNNILFTYIQQDSKILDLLNFNMLDLTGKQIHPTAEGMNIIADYFVKLLNNPAH